MNKRNKMMDALRALQSLQMICLYADDVVMRIETSLYSDTKAQSIFVIVRQNNSDHHSTGPYKSFDFYDSDGGDKITEKISKVRNFIKNITR